MLKGVIDQVKKLDKFEKFLISSLVWLVLTLTLAHIG